MSVLEKILAWSVNRPSWQRDALRRLLQQDQLTPSDTAELAQICLAAHGVSDDGSPAVAAIPLAKEHIGAAGGAGARVRLTGVRDVQRVNALASGLSYDPGHPPVRRKSVSRSRYPKVQFRLKRYTSGGRTWGSATWSP